MNVKRFGMAGAAAATLAAATIGFVPAASADPAEDAQIIAGNVPAAVQALIDGVQETVDALTETQSVEATVQALGQALVDAGTALVDGTEQFGALGLGLTLVNLGLQNALAPYAQAIDDPSLLGGIITAEDFQILAANLQAFLAAEQTSLANGLVFLLQGNIIEPPLGIGPAFYSEAVVGTLLNGFTAATGTFLEGVFQTLGITSLVVGGALEPQVSELEVALAPLFEALGPITEPIIAALEGL